MSKYFHNRAQNDKIITVQIVAKTRQNYVAYPLRKNKSIEKIIIDIGAGSFTIGDKVAVKLNEQSKGLFVGIPVQKTGIPLILGVYVRGQVYPVDRRDKAVYRVSSRGKIADNTLVQITFPRYGRIPQIVQVLRPLTKPFWQTDLSCYLYDLTASFPDEVIADLSNAKVPKSGKYRRDLTDIPFVTIDGEDAKDFDDAVWAVPDDDPDNSGGWHVMIAIADVSFYVRSGTPLDVAALARGNSVYFPDRVISMLPEKLCNDLCSLKPNQQRAALVCEVWLNAKGQKIKHCFYRALICSQARLTYTAVQQFLDKGISLSCAEQVKNLFAVYQMLNQRRHQRGVLELDVPEQQVFLSKNGQVEKIDVRPTWTSHQMIEELMILANVAAAQILEEKHSPLIYRVHARPSDEKLTAFNAFLGRTLEGEFLNADMNAKDFNRLLDIVPENNKAFLRVLNTFVLRTQSKAEYSPHNIGHFGLALEKYAHFTSPIRRYADLVVHRALVTALDMGEGGLTKTGQKELEHIAEHISNRERLSAQAENEALDRYTASFLSNHNMKTFEGLISSIGPAGLTIMTQPECFYGFIPMRFLGGTYDFDEEKQILFARSGSHEYTLGQMITVQLHEADIYTGNLIFKPKRGKDKK